MRTRAVEGGSRQLELVATRGSRRPRESTGLGESVSRPRSEAYRAEQRSSSRVSQEEIEDGPSGQESDRRGE